MKAAVAEDLSMSMSEPHTRPLDRRDADLLLLMFRGFRAIALREARSFERDGVHSGARPAEAAEPPTASL
ncbi:MAG TPA: hypothetical protein VG939_10740 [Caulobacteraceae bacterium]|nr:hypothetical protein [Caulobacteraceae bacterium]